VLFFNCLLAGLTVNEGFNSELLSEFDEALRDAFEYADLKRLVNSLPGRNFEEVVTVAGANLKHVVSDLLGNARRQGWLADLTKAAFEQSPENPKLKQFWTKYQSRLGQSPEINKGSKGRMIIVEDRSLEIAGTASLPAKPGSFSSASGEARLSLPIRADTKDFFVSYTKADQPWAEWIAWKLEEASYSTVIQTWDFRLGSNFVLEMQQAASAADRTIAVLSPKYLESSFTASEWAAAFAQDPQGKSRKLIPIRIAPCKLTGILAPINYLDLVGLPEADASAALLGAFRIRNKPTSAPAFPGATKTNAGDTVTSPVYPAASEDTSTPITEILPSIAKRSDQGRHLGAVERVQFLQQVNGILPQQFNMLLFAANPPAGLIPPMPSPQGDRTSALLTWAESPAGCGLSLIQEVLKAILEPR
jgi:TIR domain/Effector-associated domain 1